MLATKLSDIPQLEAAQLVMLTSGVVTKVLAHKPITGGRRPGSKQIVMLKEGSVTIQLNVWDREPLNAAEMLNRQVWFGCTDGEKGWNGLKVERDDYNGKVEMQLRLTPTGFISYTDPNAQGNPAHEPPRAAAPPSRQTQAPARTEAPPAPAATAAPARPLQPDHWVPMGVTVGMAVNNVCNSLTARGLALNPKQIFEEASDILRVVQRLERGEFAPKFSERQKAKPAAAKPAAPTIDPSHHADPDPEPAPTADPSDDGR